MTANALELVAGAVRRQSHAIGRGESDRCLTVFDCAVVEARAAAMAAGYPLDAIDAADERGFEQYADDIGLGVR